jgi:nucleoside-diphosphate-sugar epimerase
LCARLLAGGAEVHATSRAPRVGRAKNVRWWLADLANDGEAQAILAQVRPEVVYHLAGHVSASPRAELVLPTFQSLLASTVNLLSAALEAGVRRVVVTGSLTEPDAGDATPGSPYAAAKWASSAYARMFHQLYGSPVVILRPFMTYGPGQQGEKIIPHTILSLLSGESPRLASGRWPADWVYVDDVIEGFIQAAFALGIEGQTLDLGSGALVTTREVVEQLAQQIDAQIPLQFGALPDRPAQRERVADVEQSKRLLNWQAMTPLADGLAQTIAWYREQQASPYERQAS